MSLAEQRPSPYGAAGVAPESAFRSTSARLRSTAASVVGAVLPPLLLAAIGLGAWEAWVGWRDVPGWLVPAPSAVLDRLLGDAGLFVDHGLVTLMEAALGLLVGSAGALALAVVMAHSRFFERGLYPIAIGLKVTPVVVWAPLFALWFGFGTTPKVFIAALIAFFPMLVNAVIGLRSVDPGTHDFFRSVHAGPTEVLWHLRVPSALPYLFAGLRVAALLCVIGAVVAEWSGADRGIGHVIAVANGNLDTATVFASIVTLTLIGATLNAVISFLEGRALWWHESRRG